MGWDAGMQHWALLPVADSWCCKKLLEVLAKQCFKPCNTTKRLKAWCKGQSVSPAVRLTSSGVMCMVMKPPPRMPFME